MRQILGAWVARLEEMSINKTSRCPQVMDGRGHWAIGQTIRSSHFSRRHGCFCSGPARSHALETSLASGTRRAIPAGLHAAGDPVGSNRMGFAWRQWMVGKSFIDLQQLTGLVLESLGYCRDEDWFDSRRDCPKLEERMCESF